MKYFWTILAIMNFWALCDEIYQFIQTNVFLERLLEQGTEKAQDGQQGVSGIRDCGQKSCCAANCNTNFFKNLFKVMKRRKIYLRMIIFSGCAFLICVFKIIGK